MTSEQRRTGGRTKFCCSDLEFTKVERDIFESVRDQILSKPILQRASIKTRFYLKTDFSSLGLGFALCQPDDNEESLAAMQREDEGGECEFDFNITSLLRLLPNAFGSRKTIGSEKHFHSHPGESLSASWGIIKNRHFLWGRPFSLLSDFQALLWLMAYRGNNHAIRRLQLELVGYWFTVVNRPGNMMEDANYFSRLGANIYVDPLLKDYLSFARQSYIENPPSLDPISADNMHGRRSKRTKKDYKVVRDDLPAEINLANIDWQREPEVDVTPISCRASRDMTNVPVNITATDVVQPKSNRHFAYISETTLQLSTT
jgi:hypothetical protein